MTKSLDPPVPADRSVRLDEPAAVTVDRLPSRREPRSTRTIGQRRLRFNDDQRRLAAKAKGLGSKLLRKVALIKAFMSRTTDRFRPPYRMRLVESPRQCIFAGTVNHSTYLRDETGGRRFWPMTCGAIDIDQLARDRDQLWAEAKARFDAGCVWWLDTADRVRMASDQQTERYEG